MIVLLMDIGIFFIDENMIVHRWHTHLHIHDSLTLKANKASQCFQVSILPFSFCTCWEEFHQIYFLTAGELDTKWTNSVLKLVSLCLIMIWWIILHSFCIKNEEYISQNLHSLCFKYSLNIIISYFSKFFFSSSSSFYFFIVVN